MKVSLLILILTCLFLFGCADTPKNNPAPSATPVNEPSPTVSEDQSRTECPEGYHVAFDGKRQDPWHCAKNK